MGLVSAKLLAELKARFQLPAEMPAQEVVAAMVERIAAADAHYVQEVAVAASSGSEVPPPPRGGSMARVLGWAEATGRIAASVRPQWEAVWARDPEGTEAAVRILARPTLAPVAASSPARASSAAPPGVSDSDLEDAAFERYEERAFGIPPPAGGASERVLAAERAAMSAEDAAYEQWEGHVFGHHLPKGSQ